MIMTHLTRSQDSDDGSYWVAHHSPDFQGEVVLRRLLLVNNVPQTQEEVRVPGCLFLNLMGRAHPDRVVRDVQGRARVFWMDDLTHELRTGFLTQARVRQESPSGGPNSSEDVAWRDLHFNPRSAVQARAKRLERKLKDVLEVLESIVTDEDDVESA